MKIVRSAREIIDVYKKDSILVIYGGGNYGTELSRELRASRGADFVICDRNDKIGEDIDNFIAMEELCGMAEHGRVSVVVAVKSDESVKEIVENIINKCAKPYDDEKIDLYRYVPESREELINRRKRDGIFDGTAYRKIMNDDAAVNKLDGMITGSKPFLFARWGTTEGDIVYQRRAGIEPTEQEYSLLYQNAGVFPITEEVIASYCKVMENAALEIDMLCVFYWQKNLDRWVEWFSSKSYLVSSALEYPFFANPWTKSLKGMKVLVIHPFAELIAKQYERGDKLFANKEVLPEFELMTYRAIQSMGGNGNYKDWIEALNVMQSEISKMDFEIALIGCGAYGMPLGAFIKSKLHKKAIHMGGSLQILFGIKGKRWEDESYGYQHKLYNDYWVRPTDDLKPENYKNVEDGCYW